MALALLNATGERKGATLGANKSYDTRDFVAALTQRGIKVRLAKNTSGRCSVVSLRLSITDAQNHCFRQSDLRRRSQEKCTLY